MNIIVGKNSGFCAGVKHTIDKANENLKNYGGPLDCLGEIIHNKQVVESLESKGLRTIDSIEDAKSKVLIRAHGVSKSVYEYANKNNIELIDLTCPKVLKIHNQVQDYAKNNYFILLFGIKSHPETVGTYSFCGDNSCVIESKDDVPHALQSLYSSGLKNVLIISQTTFSLSLFNEICEFIINSLDSTYNVHVEKSICNATSLRQIETGEIASNVNLMIIIGGNNSSNTKKLCDVASKYCKNVLHIETKDDLNIDFVKNFDNIGIMAGASTPRIYY